MDQRQIHRKPWQEKPNLSMGVRALAWLLGKAQALGLNYPDFSEDKLMAAARKKTGLNDFGDPRFLEPLRLRLDYLKRNQRFSPLGRVVAWQILLKPLVNRLRIQDLVNRHPEIREQRIVRPLFIAAFPRTGTTILSQLLALDPDARPLLFWESMQPTPDPDHVVGKADPRIARAVGIVDQLRRMLPALRKIHDVDPLGPEECAGLLANAYILPIFEEDNHAYRAWIEGLSTEQVCVAYEEYKLQLQILQWQRGGGHWVLKSPLHLNWLDALLTTFPDACVVQTHRDPKQVLPSICSLDAVMQQAACGMVDCLEVGRHLSSQLAASLQRGMRARLRHSAERVFDVQYTDMLADPAAVVRAIYHHFGYAYSDIMASNIANYMAANPQHKHGAHQYQLADFGLQADEVDLRFAEYCKQFQISTTT
ncbi:sulfotransferase family protein [Zhongshania aquimaris]|uniref:Sulfotransferase n=1 Tax=Zhongshania aquimaris TaxID=2857107 RepID=A0ABS6VR77_9GAMM|nr:sulfotransferase [Zhongshania aquimaris]MBW2940822.1 sulfotransferase [Zhongshania aquimaris]